MVHIKKVEIFGFKSFGFKNTIVEFRPGLVSISGPNGSGKSNILDAIIFAMGENKPKVMRVDRLRSLMHDIEGSRSPKMTRASVHFDNSDRKIPVDTDNVEITREMDKNGENHYYLNKKKDSRSHIQDLLDIANAGLTNLNAVQQGTVTRISEFTPEEKRKSIADMIGLSDFDEKRDAARKQLDEADRRLDVALARMDEIKKRIDELEEERNHKLRYDMIQRDLGRLNAISAAQQIGSIQEQRAAKSSELSEITSAIKESTVARDKARQEIQSFEAQKSDFMEKVNAYNQAKTAIDTELSEAVRLYEEASSEIAVAEKRVRHIDGRIPEIQEEVRLAGQKLQQTESEISSARQSLEEVERQMQKAKSELESIDSQRQKVLDEQSRIAAQKNETDKKMKALYEQLNDAKLAASQASSARADIEKKIADNSARMSDQDEQRRAMTKKHSTLNLLRTKHQEAIRQMRARAEQLSARKAKLEHDLEADRMLLEKSSKVAAQYDTKIRVIKSAIPEDYTIAKLKENAKKLGIVGLTYELLEWDDKYERAVLAASTNWIKSIVVQDFATLLGITQVARERSLPRLKIIPLEAIPDVALEPPKDKGIIGVLSDYVRSKPAHRPLRTFLFGNVLLVDSQDAAYRVSRAGYRAVTLDGQLFESKSHAVTIDINSRISKITRAISMSSEVDSLQQLNVLLKKGNHKKKNRLKRLEHDIHSLKDRLASSEAELAAASQTHDDTAAHLERSAKSSAMLQERIDRLNDQLPRLSNDHTRSVSLVSSLEQRIRLVRDNYDTGAQQQIASDLQRLNSSKSSLDSEMTRLGSVQRQALSGLAALEARQSREQEAISGRNTEISSMESEKGEKNTRIAELEKDKESRNLALVKLRQKEQELISTYGTSVTQVKGYDDRLRELQEQQLQLTKSLSDHTRRSDSLGRDLKELGERHASLRRIADSYNFGEGQVPSFDVAPLLKSLSTERDSLKDLNAQAPKSYLEVSDGYRSMSDRKNSLEKERNAIVKIIEDVEREKKQLFLDAFDTVDKEIRAIFSKMTGGNAWLELQDEDDIDSSGISYLIQFPNKPKRESTSISGGEKTLAAIVYVLALQKLKPSPFYLFDEVDAHLDAPNSERLAKILEERSRQSQFIMVSLKDSVVQRAKLIYGVYPKNGVSHIVTYKDHRLSSFVKA